MKLNIQQKKIGKLKNGFIVLLLMLVSQISKTKNLRYKDRVDSILNKLRQREFKVFVQLKTLEEKVIKKIKKCYAEKS